MKIELNAPDDIELNDSEILRIEKGPWAFARSQQRKYVDLEDFRKELVHRFHDVGFEVTASCYTTDAGPDVFAFEVTIRRRLDGEFDPDRQVHEVVNNVLELPDQDGGWIKTDEALRAAEQMAKEHKH